MQLNYQTNALLPNPRKSVVTVTLAITLIGVTWGLMALMLVLVGHGARWATHGPISLFMTMGIPLGIIGLVVLPAYFSARGEFRRIETCRESFRDGKYLVRWSYSHTQWNAFRLDQAKSERSQWRVAVGLLGGFAAVFLLVAIVVLGSGPRGKDVQGAAICSGIFFILALIASGSLVWYVKWAQSRHELLAEPQDTILSTKGVYANGKWVLWGTAWRVLVRVDAKPACNTAPSRIEIAISNGKNTETQQILVPTGQDALAKQVADRIVAAPSAKKGGAGTTALTIIDLICLIIRLFA